MSHLDEVSTLLAGEGHVFALLMDGTVATWGANRCGELGDGTTTTATLPVHPQGLAPAVSVSSGACHACAALTDGSVECWGDNGEGQLGTATVESSLTPVPVPF